MTRIIIVITLIVGALLGCSQQTPNSSSEQTARLPDTVYRLKLAETWQANYPIFGATTKRLAQYVDQMSGGRLQIQIDSANKHKAPLGIFDLVKSGQYDLGHSASYYWKGKDPNTLYFSSMPFGMTAWEQYAWFEFGGGEQLMDKVYAKHGLKSVIGGNTGSQMGGWFQKEIKSIDDLKGLKMRIPGFAGEVMARVGVKPINIAGGELYTALDRKTIDALEWVGPGLDLRMGFHKIAPYYYTGWHEPGTELQFLINLKKFNQLPADLQGILVDAMKLTAYQTYAESTYRNAENWALIKQDYPAIKIKTFPPAVIDALQVANEQLLEERAAQSPIAREIIASQRAFLKKARDWTLISDHSYLNSVQ